jgi:hypothetical protein
MQSGQFGPPQSSSVSSWFWTESEQDAAWQTRRVHTPLSQSVGSAQSSPAAQGPHVMPPQSVSVSVPFCMPSMHDAGTHSSA